MNVAVGTYGVAPTLAATTPRALAWHAVLVVAAAFVLPALAHAAGAPVNAWVPMHWPVLLAGLLYGWRSGLVIGMLSPLVAFSVSGMPPAFMLPAMVVELASYGVVAGLLRETFRVNSFVSVLAAVVAGRLMYIVATWASVMLGLREPNGRSFLESVVAFEPAVLAMIAQVVLLPLLAHALMARSRR